MHPDDDTGRVSALATRYARLYIGAVHSILKIGLALDRLKPWFLVFPDRLTRPMCIGLQRRGHRRCYLSLNLEDVLQVSIIGLRPQLKACNGVDELSGDSDVSAVLAHAAFQYYADVELAGDVA